MTCQTDLCNIAIKHKTDKVFAYRHNYTPCYFSLFEGKRYDRNNILEIGLGYVGYDETYGNIMQHMKNENYVPGASHRMWEEFFPNSLIYGLDINEKILFNTERIKTFRANQYHKEDLDLFMKAIGSETKFDIIIDDGSHVPEHQIFTMLYFLDKINQETGIYVIEDVTEKFYKNLDMYLTSEVRERVKSYGFDIETIDLTHISNSRISDDFMIVIRKCF
jgi:hypothetical protein